MLIAHGAYQSNAQASNIDVALPFLPNYLSMWMHVTARQPVVWVEGMPTGECCWGGNALGLDTGGVVSVAVDKFVVGTTGVGGDVNDGVNPCSWIAFGEGGGGREVKAVKWTGDGGGAGRVITVGFDDVSLSVDFIAHGNEKATQFSIGFVAPDDPTQNNRWNATGDEVGKCDAFGVNQFTVGAFWNVSGDDYYVVCVSTKPTGHLGGQLDNLARTGLGATAAWELTLPGGLLWMPTATWLKQKQNERGVICTWPYSATRKPTPDFFFDPGVSLTERSGNNTTSGFGGGDGIWSLDETTSPRRGLRGGSRHPNGLVYDEIASTHRHVYFRQQAYDPPPPDIGVLDVDLQAGIVGHWKGGDLLDSSGNGNHLIDKVGTGWTFTAGLSGNALTGDGTVASFRQQADGLTVVDSFGVDSFAFACKFKYADFVSNPMLMRCGNASGVLAGYKTLVLAASGLIRTAFADGTTVLNTDKGLPSTGAWHSYFVVVSRVLGRAWIFLDASLIAAANISAFGSFSTTVGGLGIGVDSDDGGNNRMNGQIDQSVIWDKAAKFYASFDHSRKGARLYHGARPGGPPIGVVI